MSVKNGVDIIGYVEYNSIIGNGVWYMIYYVTIEEIISEKLKSMQIQLMRLRILLKKNIMKENFDEL